MAKPNKLDIIWGLNGVSVDPGDTKFELGWEAEIPPYQYFNYVLNKTSQMLDHINTHGIPEWDVLTEYVLGSRVLHIGIEYKCTKATSTGELPTDLVDWINSEFEDRVTALETKTPQSYKTDDDVVFETVDTGYGANNVVPEGVTFDRINGASADINLPDLDEKQTGTIAISFPSNSVTVFLPSGGTFSVSHIQWTGSFMTVESDQSRGGGGSLMTLSTNYSVIVTYTRLTI
jgi:hypothetical protein